MTSKLSEGRLKARRSGSLSSKRALNFFKGGSMLGVSNSSIDCNANSGAAVPALRFRGREGRGKSGICEPFV